MFGGEGGPEDSVVIDMTDEEVNETRTLRAMVHAQQDANLGMPTPTPTPAKPTKPAKATKPAKPAKLSSPIEIRRSARETHPPVRLNYDYYNR